MTDNLICLSCEHYDSSDSNSELCGLKTEVTVPTQTCMNHSLIKERYPNASIFLKVINFGQDSIFKDNIFDQFEDFLQGVEDEVIKEMENRVNSTVPASRSNSLFNKEFCSPIGWQDSFADNIIKSLFDYFSLESLYFALDSYFDLLSDFGDNLNGSPYELYLPEGQNRYFYLFDSEIDLPVAIFDVRASRFSLYEYNSHYFNEFRRAFMFTAIETYDSYENQNLDAVMKDTVRIPIFQNDNDS